MYKSSSIEPGTLGRSVSIDFRPLEGVKDTRFFPLRMKDRCVCVRGSRLTIGV